MPIADDFPAIAAGLRKLEPGLPRTVAKPAPNLFVINWNISGVERDAVDPGYAYRSTFVFEGEPDSKRAARLTFQRILNEIDRERLAAPTTVKWSAPQNPEEW